MIKTFTAMAGQATVRVDAASFSEAAELAAPALREILQPHINKDSEDYPIDLVVRDEMTDHEETFSFES